MKQKTNRSAQKRFRLTGGHKVMRNKAFKSHLLSSKKRKRKRNLGKPTVVDPANLKGVRRMLPYL